MKISLIAAALLSLPFVITGPSIAESTQQSNSVLSVQDMYYSCKEAIKYKDGRDGFEVSKASICVSGINWIGISASMADNIYSSNGRNEKLAYKYMFGCPKAGLTVNNDVLIRVFVKAVDDNPKLMAMHLLDGLHIIMNREFPCNEAKVGQ